LRGLVGENGKIHSLDHFGYSAPYKMLDEEFGFTPEKIAEKLKELLQERRPKNNQSRFLGLFFRSN
ncbi:hypothetical protein IRY61_04595, partial [Candidatus Saccharibacteria bacterium]|nr:hypothetical protein [Candidatus Saccharibacteria bacterium]